MRTREYVARLVEERFGSYHTIEPVYRHYRGSDFSISGVFLEPTDSIWFFGDIYWFDKANVDGAMAVQGFYPVLISFQGVPTEPNHVEDVLCNEFVGNGAEVRLSLTGWKIRLKA